MNFPKVSIIILNWNGLVDTVECLDSLKTITYPNYKVIVVDNGSEGDDVKILREKFGDYTNVIENNRNYGFAEGSNIGIKYGLSADAEYVLLLNNDTIVHHDFLDELVKEALSHDKVGIVGPKIYFYEQPDKVCVTGNFINYWTGNLFSRKRGLVNIEQVEHAVEVDWVSGCCMLISREVLLNVGLLDPSFSLYCEEHDICIRAAKRGFKSMFVPKAKIWHKISTRKAFRNRKSTSYDVYAYSLVRSRFVLMKKHWSRLQFVTSCICYFASWPRLFIEYLIYYRQWNMLKGFVKGFVESLGQSFKNKPS